MSATALRDRLRLGNPIGVPLDESVSSYPTPVIPHCPNTGPRPGWLLSKWHCAQDHQLDQRYGIRCGDYWRLFEAQEGRCALCGYEPRRWRLVVHHDHQTGAVVALLHFPCNRVIDPLMWLLPRLVALMVDPPGRELGLVVPAGKRERLEAQQRAKAARAQARPPTRETGNGNGSVSNLDRLRAMTTQGGT
jgi:ribosomal protein L37E